jgi:hypothetical protein
VLISTSERTGRTGANSQLKRKQQQMSLFFLWVSAQSYQKGKFILLNLSDFCPSKTECGFKNDLSQQ